MATSRSREARAARERARAYREHQAAHRDRVRRRTRDNLLAGILGGALVAGIVGAQVAFFTVGPGSAAAPAPAPAPLSTEVIPGPAGTPIP